MPLCPPVQTWRQMVQARWPSHLEQVAAADGCVGWGAAATLAVRNTLTNVVSFVFITYHPSYALVARNAAGEGGSGLAIDCRWVVGYGHPPPPCLLATVDRLQASLVLRAHLRGDKTRPANIAHSAPLRSQVVDGNEVGGNAEGAHQCP
jgi:hypothetical protein